MGVIGLIGVFRTMKILTLIFNGFIILVFISTIVLSIIEL